MPNPFKQYSKRIDKIHQCCGQVIKTTFSGPLHIQKNEYPPPTINHKIMI
jgi:hypothetical protein